MVDIESDHPAAVTIPGCVDGMVSLVETFGRLDMMTILQPAIALATEGFEVSTELAAAFTNQARTYSSNPAVSSFYSDGRPPNRGDTVVRADLGRTLLEIAEHGRSAFYEGVPGEDMIAAVSGLISMEDLTQSQASWVDPISIEVSGLTSWTIPPNSQGYLGPATVAVFDMLDPPEDPGDPLWWHLLIEAYRCLAWERNDLVADPGNLALPAHLLLDTVRLQRAADSVNPEQAGVWPDRIGTTRGTAYMCLADDEGMAVSLIQSNYRGTGSQFGAARSGFLLHDRGLGFTLTPGHPNELAPRKRPLHTLSPTLWTDGGGPRWLLGTRGGAVQPQLIAQMAARVILGDSDLATAQTAPRWTTREFGSGTPPRPRIEPSVSTAVIDGLKQRGHEVTLVESPQPGWGPISIIELEGTTRRTATDPRVDTTAAFVY